MFAIDFTNPWVAGVDAARRRAPAWLVYATALGLAAGVVLVGGRAAEAVRAGLASWGGAAASPWLAAWDLVGADVFVFLPLIVIALAAAALEGRRLFPRAGRPIVQAARGALGGACAYGLAVGVVAALGAVRIGGGAPTGAAALGGATAGAALVAVQAGAEEVYFRGWLQPLVCARWGPWLGGAAAAAAFAALHLLGAVAAPLALANTFLAGLALGLLALRTGGLWASIAAHGAWNCTESFVLGTDPNPGLGPLGALVDLDLGGGALWSGGTDGMNGSLAATVVLTAAIAGLLAVRPAARSAAAEAGAPLTDRKTDRLNTGK